jgi:hypothetical protein
MPTPSCLLTSVKVGCPALRAKSLRSCHEVEGPSPSTLTWQKHPTHGQKRPASAGRSGLAAPAALACSLAAPTRPRHLDCRQPWRDETGSSSRSTPATARGLLLNLPPHAGTPRHSPIDTPIVTSISLNRARRSRAEGPQARSGDKQRAAGAATSNELLPESVCVQALKKSTWHGPKPPDPSRSASLSESPMPLRRQHTRFCPVSRGPLAVPPPPPRPSCLPFSTLSLRPSEQSCSDLQRHTTATPHRILNGLVRPRPWAYGISTRQALSPSRSAALLPFSRSPSAGMSAMSPAVRYLIAPSPEESQRRWFPRNSADSLLKLPARAHRKQGEA